MSDIDTLALFDEIQNMISERSEDDQALIKKASQYSVSIYRYQQKELEKTGGLYWICGNSVAVLADENYDSKTGFTMKRQQMSYMEV